MTDELERYQVFGRTAYETPLTFICEIAVAQSVRDEALAAAGDAAWVELIAVPSRDLLPVIGGERDG